MVWKWGAGGGLVWRNHARVRAQSTLLLPPLSNLPVNCWHIDHLMPASPSSSYPRSPSRSPPDVLRSIARRWRAPTRQHLLPPLPTRLSPCSQADTYTKEVNARTAPAVFAGAPAPALIHRLTQQRPPPPMSHHPRCNEPPGPDTHTHLPTKLQAAPRVPPSHSPPYSYSPLPRPTLRSPLPKAPCPSQLAWPHDHTQLPSPLCSERRVPQVLAWLGSESLHSLLEAEASRPLRCSPPSMAPIQTP